MTSMSFRWNDLPVELRGLILDELILLAIYEGPNEPKKPWVSACDGIIDSNYALALELQQHLWIKSNLLWTERSTLSQTFESLKQADQADCLAHAMLLSHVECKVLAQYKCSLAHGFEVFISRPRRRARCHEARQLFWTRPRDASWTADVVGTLRAFFTCCETTDMRRFHSVPGCKLWPRQLMERIQPGHIEPF